MTSRSEMSATAWNNVEGIAAIVDGPNKIRLHKGR